jgi:hypothetical protein
MKQTFIFFFTAVLALTACRKESTQPSNAEVTGQVLFGGDRTMDGIGYYIRTDNDHETLSPQNLPAEFKHATVNAHVAFRYFDTGATLNTDMAPGATGPRVIVLRSIRAL